MLYSCERFCKLTYARTLNDEYIDLALTRRDPYDGTKGLFCKNSESICAMSRVFESPGIPLLLVSNQKKAGKSMAKGIVFVERQVYLQDYLDEDMNNIHKLIDIQILKKRAWPVLLLLSDFRLLFQEPIEFPKTHSKEKEIRNSLVWSISNLGLKAISEALPLAVIV